MHKRKQLISSSTREKKHKLIIDINKNAIANDTKFVEIEIHKMKNINAKETIITLPAIHNFMK